MKWMEAGQSLHASGLKKSARHWYPKTLPQPPRFSAEKAMLPRVRARASLLPLPPAKRGAGTRGARVAHGPADLLRRNRRSTGVSTHPRENGLQARMRFGKVRWNRCTNAWRTTVGAGLRPAIGLKQKRVSDPPLSLKKKTRVSDPPLV